MGYAVGTPDVFVQEGLKAAALVEKKCKWYNNGTWELPSLSIIFFIQFLIESLAQVG